MSVHRAELGADPLRAVAADFDAATAGPEGIAEYAFIRDSQLGLGVSGPYAQISALASALSEKIGEVATTLYVLAHNASG